MSYILPLPMPRLRVDDRDNTIRQLREEIRFLESELHEAKDELDDRIDPANADHLAEIVRQILPLIDDPLIRYDLESACEAVEKQ